ncbi:MAG: hypothetical protein KDA89_04045 [Planctomycetaceae bacterium]|nr:hypothetical protein [Planctomycetaceae bacterium]
MRTLVSDHWQRQLLLRAEAQNGVWSRARVKTCPGTNPGKLYAGFSETRITDGTDFGEIGLQLEQALFQGFVAGQLLHAVRSEDSEVR